jgi:two-component system, cell cycle sensor histidine kinase and response regulator CckA
MENTNPLHILFVEDVPSDAILAERVIRKSGIEFSSQRVDTKDAFLKALDEFAPDIIVSDYSMPEFDGMQALLLSLERDARLPFILLTGSMNEETAVLCMKAGASDYVIKEHIKRLPFAVKEALDQKKMRAVKDETERALQESEHRTRTFLDSTSDMVFLKDDKFRHLFANRALCKFYGKTEDEIRLKKDGVLMSKEAAHRCRRTDEQTLLSNALTVNEELIGDQHYETVKFPVEIGLGKVGVGGYIRDITERKRAEDAMRLQSAALEAAANAIVITDSEGIIEWANLAFSTLTGYAPNESIGRNPRELVKSGKHDQAFYKDLWDKVLAGKTWRGQLINRRKDGSFYTEEQTITPLRDASCKISHFIAIKEDITERKRVEEALRKSEEQYRNLIDTMNEGVFISDISGTITFANKELANIHGYDSPDQLLGRHFAEFVEPSMRHKIAHGHGIEMQGGEILPSQDIPIVKPDGSIAYVRVRPRSIYEGERIVGVTGIVQDITDQKRAEDALADSERRFKWLFEYAPIAYHVLTPEGIITDVNVRWCETLGYSKPEVLGKPIFDFILESERPIAKTLFETKKKHIAAIRTRNERNYVAKDGAVKTFLVSDVFAAGGNGKITAVQTTMEDITERKKAELDLRLSEERFHSVWDNSADSMRLTDREGRIIDVNPSFCKLVRKSREELLGKSLSVAYKTKGPDDTLASYYQRFDARETISNLLGSATLWNGESVDLDISSSYVETVGQERLLLSILRDVTEQRKLQKGLDQERTLLRTIIDAIPDEISVKDMERRFVLVNRGTIQALKRSSEEEIIGKRDEDLIPEAFALHARAQEEPVLASGRPSINKLGEPKMNSSTGEIERAILISKIPLKDSTGTIVGLVGINRDITEVQRANASLEKERSLLLTVIESIPDEIGLKDTAHRFIVANSALVRAIGARSGKDLLGKTDADFMRPEIAQDHNDEEDAILVSGEPVVNAEQIRRDPVTGEIERCLLTTKVPVRDKAGKKIGILVVNRYITERKRAEEALRFSEEKFRTLFEESKDTVYFSTVEGSLLDINAAGVELFGYTSKDELVQIGLKGDSYVDPERRVQFRKEMEERGFVKDFELMFKKKGGGTLAVLETATAVRDKLGHVIMHRGIIHDVTRQKQLELQFLQAQKMESIGTLAGGIAHDFNNILGIVLGHLALLERTRNDNAQFEESIFSINKAVERGASLVRQILTFARKTDTELEPVSINATIKELAKMLEETFPKTMSVTLQLDKNIPVVSLDPTQLHQALLNLSVNARDAMNGNGTLSIATHLVSGRDVSSRFPKAMAGHYVHVRVSDTGTGMDEETRQRIFEPFFTTKEKGKGTGLGLAVVYGVLQAHNGFVDVESMKGKGSTFHLFFPVPEGILAPILQRPGIQDDLPRGTETILVVEDEDILRDILVKLLEMQGYKVIPASDGDEAVRRFNEHAGTIDLVLSDMGLPKLSGWDAIKAMQGTGVDVRALLASGYLDPGQKSEVLKSGVRGFIQKPYKMEEVLKAVREALDEQE